MPNGGWIKYDGGRCQVLLRGTLAGGDHLLIDKAYIAKCASATSSTPDIVGPSVLLCENRLIMDGWSTWTSFTNFPIDKTQTYVISMLINNGVGNGDAWTYRETNDISAVGTYVIPASSGPLAADLTDLTWTDRGDVISSNYVIAVARLASTYPTNGTYTSAIYDTHVARPDYRTMSSRWVMPTNPGASVRFKVRTADNADMSDATAWGSVATNAMGSIDPGDRRYMQFQTIMTPSADGFRSPKLNDLSVGWTGVVSMVDIGGTLTMGPQYGVFKIEVDGVVITKCLTVDLEIYKDTAGFAGTRRITSALSAEIQPRNTGK